MRILSNHLGAWAVVGALAVSVVAVWGNDAPDRMTVAYDKGFCADEIVVSGVTLPGHSAWRPDPVLTGAPEESDAPLTSYEFSEQRVLARLDQRGDTEPQVLAVYGSSTNLKPINMC